MEIGTGTQIILNAGTLVGLGIFIRSTSASFSQTKLQLDSCKKNIDNINDRMDEHKEEHKNENIAERLARIETDIQWIRQTLSDKGKK